MTNQHPITPPPELVEQWDSECESDVDAAMYLATQAARWGSDQELEACCEWLLGWKVDLYPGGIYNLRLARRPKPPSLKEQALHALENADGADHPVVATVLTAEQHALIRKALETLDD